MLAAEEKIAVEAADASADLDALVRRAEATSTASNSIAWGFPVSVSPRRSTDQTRRELHMRAETRLP
jgi:hypothetical protein